MIVKRKNFKVCWFFLNIQCVQCARFDLVSFFAVHLPVLLLNTLYFRILWKYRVSRKKRSLVFRGLYLLRLSAFIWTQKVQDYLKASLRKLNLFVTLTQDLALLYHRYSLLKEVLRCSNKPKSQSPLPNWHYNPIDHYSCSQALRNTC